METKGKMYHCDGLGCKAKIFLEDGENIEDMEWVRIPGHGLFCPECAPAVSERAKSEAVLFFDNVNEIFGVTK